MQNQDYQIDEALIFSEGNVEIDGKRVYLPIYMIIFLEEARLENTVYKLDLSGLKNI